MLFSIALILLVGMLFGWLCRQLRLPALIGMLFTGILLGPGMLDFLDNRLLAISADIRKIALIIILTRAGLNLDLTGLKKQGRPALLLCFLPATFELLGIILLGKPLLGLSTAESAILGSVLAAVSPAVVVPRMVRLMEEGYGTQKGIPQMILAAASVDDIYVIVLFSTFTGMVQGSTLSIMQFVNIPFSIFTGIAIGIGTGLLFTRFCQRFRLPKTVAVLLVLCISFLLCAIEDTLSTPLTFSALIAIMALGLSIKQNAPEQAREYNSVYQQLWTAAEIFLFVLVGACVDLHSLGNIWPLALATILLALIFRMVGVAFCTIGTSLSIKERFFSMLAYTPKATVQAAIGSIPLALGLSCGNTVLTSAVLAILITAPLGAFAIDRSYQHLLQQNNN